MALSCLHDAPVYLFPPLLGFLAFFSLALLSFLKSRRSQTNTYFAFLCLLGATLNLDVALISAVGNRQTAVLIDKTFYLFFVFTPPVYIRFIHSFLSLNRRKIIEYAALGLSVSLIPLIPSDLFIAGMRDYPYGRIAVAGPAFHVFSVTGGAAVLYCLALLVRGIRRAANNHERNRIKYILSGVGLSAALITSNYAAVLGADVYPFGNLSFIPAAVLAVGIMKYDLFDIDAAIRKGILYFLLSLILTFSFLATIYASHYFVLPSASPILPFALAFLLSAFFQPFKDRLQKIIDRLFFRGKYDYQATLKDVSRELGSLLSPGEVRKIVVSSISSALHVSEVALYTFEGEEVRLTDLDGSRALGPGEFLSHRPVAAALAKEKSIFNCARFSKSRGGGAEDYFCTGKAAVLVPLLTGDKLQGFMAVGEKKSGDLFVHEDLQLLMTVANQGAIALDNARLYSRLEEMNRGLEKKVWDRTAELLREIEEKEATRKLLVQSESLAAIGQLVAGTAHELNNPLASASSLVQTSIEYLGDKSAKGEDEKELIGDLEFTLRELKRARDIIKSLLSLSRQTVNLTEQVDVNAVLEDALVVLHNTHKNSPLKINRNYGALPAVRGNFGALGQVFINIIKNAVEAAPGERGEISISTSRLNKRVVVECSDNGAGIPREIVKDIFKPFFTTKEVGKGTGLGLYICHEIVNRHGGSIYAGSNPGGGTRITIELPEGEM